MDHLTSICLEGERFYATSEVADVTLGVPSCPGWSIPDLVWHLGEVHWFWATDIERRATAPEQVEPDKPPRPSSYEELIGFGRSQLEHLLEVLGSTSDGTAVWTWAQQESDHTVGFVRRHQVQETAVHRWDLQDAATSDEPDPIAAEAASDSIDEFLHVTLPWGVNNDRPLPGSVHLHCLDTAGEWVVQRDGRIERGHAKGDVAVRGSASDLLLALYNRIDLGALDVVGEAAIAREMLDRVEGT